MPQVVLLFLALTLSTETQVSVVTYHNNLARTGENLNETFLTKANVNPSQFGKLLSLPVDGQVYAQPLYLPSVPIAGTLHNVVFVATEHDSVYAFDADSSSGTSPSPLWHVSLLGAGERTAGVADVLNCPAISPEVGITGTPVIDPSTNTLYAVALTVWNAEIIQRLHALDVTSGAERPGSPVVITASVPGSSGSLSPGLTVEFNPGFYKNRAGLLLLNGVVYTGWASHCDLLSYHGWLLAYDAKDLHQISVFNTTPNANQGSFWMGGAAPAADADGSIYAISGNGPFDAVPNGLDFGDSILKLSSPGLKVLDYFTPFNQMDMDQADIDLGSSTAVLLPAAAGSRTHPHLLVSAGKEGRIYLIDRDQLGHFNASGDTQIVQSFSGAVQSVFGAPAYFNNTIYFAAAFDRFKAFSISDAHIGPSPSSQSSQTFAYGGAVPVVTANGSSNGIVWVVEASFGGTLRAYDASNLANELYDSQISGSRDALGSPPQFCVPIVANGRVYVGTKSALVVFGLLNQPSPESLVNAASLQPGAVAPGSLITIFGTNLADRTVAAPGGSPPRTLAGVTLSINGIAAPLLFVSPDQINAQVPYETEEGTATARLEAPRMPPVTIQFATAAVAPAVFSTSQGLSAVINGDDSQNTSDHPASVGSTVALYLTGQGAVAPPISTGQPGPDSPAKTIYPVTATVGRRAAVITFAGLRPGVVGIFEIDLTIPATPSGSQPLVVTVNGVPSTTAHVFVSTAPGQTNRQR